MKRPHVRPAPIGQAVASHDAAASGAPNAGTAAADGMLARFARRPLTQQAPIRMHALLRHNGELARRRRVGPKVGFIAPWIAGRTTGDEVTYWLDGGRMFPRDPMKEAFSALIVARLRAEFVRADGFEDIARRQYVFPVACLAYVLWVNALESRQRGVLWFVQGLARGMLAKLSATWNGEKPFDVDTITIHLRRLRRVLEGLLIFWQPSNAEAVLYGLPHSTHYPGEEHQAINIYRWLCPKSAEWLTYWETRGGVVDPGSAYGRSSKDQRSAIQRPRRSESPSAPSAAQATNDPAPYGRLPANGSATATVSARPSRPPATTALEGSSTPPRRIEAPSARQSIALLEDRHRRGDVVPFLEIKSALDSIFTRRNR